MFTFATNRAHFSPGPHQFTLNSLVRLFSLLCTFGFIPAFASSGYADDILGHYFDVAPGSDPGTWVHGMLNPRRNRAFRSDPPIDFTFTLDDDGAGVFELINHRDGEGRLFGAIRTKAPVGAAGTSYSLRTSLSRISTGATVSSLDFIVEVKDTPMIEVMRTRALEWAFTEDKLWGRNEPSESALETQVSYVENNGGELKNNELYAWSKSQKRTKSTLDDKWIKAVEDLGALGWAYLDRPKAWKWEQSAEVGQNAMNPLDSQLKTRVGAAIKTALVALAEAIPVDATDVFDSGDLSSLSHNGKDYHGEGFAGRPTMNTLSNNQVTHQWEFTEAVGLAVMAVGQDLHAAALNGNANAVAAMDAIVRLGTPNFALTENRRWIDNPKTPGGGARWGDLLSNHAQGVWMDANLAHRLRAWTAFAIAVNDYNRPATYVDYWHDDFNFSAIRYEGSDASSPPTSIPDGFRLIPGFKNEGVFGDVSALLGGGYVRPRRRGMSGYLPDGIISHHAKDCQDAAMFAYGFEWLEAPLRVARIFKGTPFAMSSAALAAVPARWLVYSYSRIIFKGGIDIALIGRVYHAETSGTFWNKQAIPAAKYLVQDHASALDSDVLTTLQTWISGDTINGPPQETSLGNTAFFNSDAMVHRASDAGTGDEWYISVRFKTSRTQGNEDFESTGKSWHMGSGMLQVKVFGDEYDLVRARMDWHVMPGVTEEWRTDSISKSSEGRCGGSTYGGSVSDGEVGAAAMHYTPHADDDDDYSVTSADKAWFFGSFGAVALGRGINRAKTGQGNEIVTTLEQARWRGPVTIQVGSSGSSLTLPHDLNSGCSEDRTIPAGETAFLHQGGVGYVIVAPASSSVTLSIRCGNNVIATDSSMAGKSSWGDRTDPENRDRWDPDAGDWYKSDRPFLAVLKHGTAPADAAYQYAVLPAMKVLDAAAKARAFAFFGSEVQVIQNDASAQAVVFPPTGDFRTFQCAFLSANEDVVAPLSSSLTFTVSVDRPAIVQVRTLSDGRFGLAVVDGIADKTARVLKVHLGQDELLEPGSYPYALPGVEPKTAVDAVDVSQSGGRTLISFGLPDATDDAVYGYQGDLYVGAPVSVKVPKRGGPCDASASPTNGGVGDCTNSLASGSTCQPTCNSGYTVSGTSSCSAGTLTAATCSANSCTASSVLSKDGSDGVFYCINGGTVGGTTGSCTCTSCNEGYGGASCETVSTLGNTPTSERKEKAEKTRDAMLNKIKDKKMKKKAELLANAAIGGKKVKKISGKLIALDEDTACSDYYTKANLDKTLGACVATSSSSMATTYDVSIIFSSDEVDDATLTAAVNSLEAEGVSGVSLDVDLDPVSELKTIDGVDATTLATFETEAAAAAAEAIATPPPAPPPAVLVNVASHAPSTPSTFLLVMVTGLNFLL